MGWGAVEGTHILATEVLTSHANASLTPTGRLGLARCIVDDEWPLRSAADRFGVSVTTARGGPTRSDAVRRGPPPEHPCAGTEGAYTDVRWRVVDATTAHQEGRLDGRDFHPIYDRPTTMSRVRRQTIPVTSPGAQGATLTQLTIEPRLGSRDEPPVPQRLASTPPRKVR